MASLPSAYSAYKQVDVETASQGKLIVMLFNGAIQRASEASRLLQSDGAISEIHNSLTRAQDIISELRSALNMEIGGEIAANLDRSYEYLYHLLVTANLKKDAAPLAECIELMTQLRDTWDEVFMKNAQDDLPEPAPSVNPHGSSVMNFQG
jgi:flagellar secretion chaperone FliS